jgi:hypothetical protein
MPGLGKVREEERRTTEKDESTVHSIPSDPLVEGNRCQVTSLFPYKCCYTNKDFIKLEKSTSYKQTTRNTPHIAIGNEEKAMAGSQSGGMHERCMIH